MWLIHALTGSLFVAPLDETRGEDATELPDESGRQDDQYPLQYRPNRG